RCSRARKKGRLLRGSSPSEQARRTLLGSGDREGTSRNASTMHREPWNKRVTNEEVVAAYKDTGSVWKAAKRLGVCGQSVHERLRRLGHRMTHQTWTVEEVREARSLASQGEPMAQIASRLGRTYSAVALKLSRLGIGSQHKGWRWKPRRKMILSKGRVAALGRKLERGAATLRRWPPPEGVAITPLVDALQVYEPERWRRYVEHHSNLSRRPCP